MINSRFKLAYVPELDGLRGVAILAVMLFHAEVPFFEGGFIGVDIFFVLSGFLITSLLIQEFDCMSYINLKYFYMRRVLRLGPSLIFLLVVFCLLSFVVLNNEMAIDNLIDALISLVYLSNWARAFMWHSPDFLGHTWSLSIEEQFYILWPVILLTLLRIKKNRWCIVITAALIALFSWLLRCYLVMGGVPAERLYNGLDTRADALMVGCTLGVLISSDLISEDVKGCLSKWLIAIAPFSMVGLIAFSILCKWQDPSMYYFGFFVVELLTVALVLDILVSKRSIIGKILAMRWLIWVGSISYGLYLWHYPIYRTMLALGFNRLAIILVGTFVTFVVAACSYYFLERPILKFRKSFIYTTPNKSISRPLLSMRSAQAEMSYCKFSCDRGGPLHESDRS
jgi:peptidoglycan/LPS O-acetylase OafA/YrhL